MSDAKTSEVKTSEAKVSGSTTKGSEKTQRSTEVMAFDPTPSAITHTQTNETGLSGVPTKTSRGPGTTDMTTTETQTGTDDPRDGSRLGKDKGVNVAVKVGLCTLPCWII